MKRIVVLIIILVIGVAAGVLYTLFPPEPVQVSAVIGEDGELTLQPTQEPAAEKKRDVLGFSHKAGFYSENISVELSCGEGASVYFTDDGSDPVAEPKNLYKTPIEINAGPEVRATTIKAFVVSPDGTQSDIVTRSFVCGADVDERFSDDTLVFVLSSDPYNLYDYEYGIAVPGKIYDDYVKEHPGEEIPYNAPGNYFINGRESERDIYVEVFENDGDNVISQAAGVRVVGGYSRVVNQKSLRLIARKEYDPENGKFKYAFFDDAVNAEGEPILEFDRLTLRNGANDREFAGVRDELSQQLAQDYGFPCIQNTRPCAVFLNGEYYGYSWLHESYCESYLETRFGGSKEQYGIIENVEVPDIERLREEGEIIEQPMLDYLAMCEYYDKDLTNDAVFAEFCELVDIENLMQYYCMQIFVGNRDWPGNNFKAFRYYPAEGEELTSKYMDGKWRFLFFDVEFCWGLYGNGFKDRTLSDLLDGSHMSGQSKALKALLARKDMQQLYANTMCDLAAYAFSENHIKEVLEELIEISDPEQMYALELGITSEWARKHTFEESRA
ncbi:MAG: CotH kinase family protein, partial [Oscillospiraceae bacterium]